MPEESTRYVLALVNDLTVIIHRTCLMPRCVLKGTREVLSRHEPRRLAMSHTFSTADIAVDCRLAFRTPSRHGVKLLSKLRL